MCLKESEVLLGARNKKISVCVIVAAAITHTVVLCGVTYPVSQRIRYARYRLYHITFEKVF